MRRYCASVILDGLLLFDYQAHEAQQLLHNGTYDLSRMAKVLENQRVCLVTIKTFRSFKSFAIVRFSSLLTRVP